MIRLAVLGAGAHATSQHLPALLDYEQRQPGSLCIVGVCDRDPARAGRVAAPLGAAVHTDWQRCLAEMRPDAVLVCLPPALTPTVARAASRGGAAVWVEKPLASTLAEAEALVAELGPRAFASMNRRFDPALARLRDRCAGRPIRSMRAILAREHRAEEDFIFATGVHLADQAVSLVGPPADTPRLQRRGSWAHLAWTTAAGCSVDCDLRPTLGVNLEAVELTGDGWRGEARSGWFDLGCTDWQESGQPSQREFLDRTQPDWQRNGTAAETAAFLAAVRGEGPWDPHPAAVLAATALCHATMRVAQS